MPIQIIPEKQGVGFMTDNKGALHLPGGKKGESLLDRYTKPQRNKAIEGAIEDPAAEIDSLKKKIAKLEKKLRGFQKSVDKAVATSFNTEMRLAAHIDKEKHDE